MSDLFSRPPLFVGMVHLLPLPGAPRFGGDLRAVLEAARSDACALAEGGCDAVLVENFGDVPFWGERVPPETVAAMALALDAVRAEAGALPLGVNCLRNDARSALGLAAATGARFVRVNVHVGAAVTDQGVLEGRAAQTLRERARLCPQVAILADVHVKHATPLGAEPIERAARETVERGLADALVVSGSGTGARTAQADLERVRESVPSAPLLVGSGFDEESARELLAVADGAIVGTWLKRDGRADAPVDRERVARLARLFRELRALP